MLKVDMIPRVYRWLSASKYCDGFRSPGDKVSQD